MSDKVGWSCLGVILGAVASLILNFVLAYPFLQEGGYRAGQIDAARGVMKYELREQDDGTTTWELIADR